MSDIEIIVGSDTLPARVRHELRRFNHHLFPHHLCHAASAYLMLPLGAKAGIIVYDGYGSVIGPVEGEQFRAARETFSFYRFAHDGYECLGRSHGLAYTETDDFQTGLTNSIGMLYELVTSLLGYDAMDGGKTMGLAAYGIPRYIDLFERYISYGSSPSDCFRCATDNQEFVESIRRLLGGVASFSVRADLAATVQAIINKTLLHCSTFFTDMDIEYVCVAGGCALNSVSNAHLASESTSKLPVLIPPHCGDAGLAFGALWLERLRQAGQCPDLTFREQRPVSRYISRPGRVYHDHERRTAIHNHYPNLIFDPTIRSASSLAKKIAQGAVIALFRGSSEFGPRALGGRSILADPRNVATRERINRTIKFREPFRPLAPIVLQSDYEKYFTDVNCADYFMLKTARVKQVCLQQAPAAVHVDGTARVQLVSEQTDPFLAELLACFRNETGVGILINTSFNQRGEPIVESPEDAVVSFLRMGIDGLFMDGEYFVNAESLVAGPASAA